MSEETEKPKICKTHSVIQRTSLQILEQLRYICTLGATGFVFLFKFAAKIEQRSRYREERERAFFFPAGKNPLVPRGMHLRRRLSLRKLELALHDFQFLKFVCEFYATVSPNNITIVEMRLNQGFVDKMQCCWGNKFPDTFNSSAAIPEAIFFSQLLDMTAPGKVCINEYTQRF